MDLWFLIQIVIVAFFVLVPVGVVLLFLWIKRIIDENRELAQKEIELLGNDESGYGMCGACGEPIKRGFLFCPVCHKKLGNKCPNCDRFLKITWTKCPYCGESYGIEEVTEKGKQQSLLEEYPR